MDASSLQIQKLEVGNVSGPKLEAMPVPYTHLPEGFVGEAEGDVVVGGPSLYSREAADLSPPTLSGPTLDRHKTGLRDKAPYLRSHSQNRAWNP